MGFALVLLLCLLAPLLFFSAAKTHGRQVRLERELEGFEEIDFRRRTPNAPFVERLWRHDRTHYWTSAAVIALVLGMVLAWTQIASVPIGIKVPWALVLIPFLGLVLAFDLQALSSSRRFAHKQDLPPPATAGPTQRYANSEWKKEARRGTLRWLLATNLLLVAFLAALVAQGLS